MENLVADAFQSAKHWISMAVLDTELIAYLVYLMAR